MKIEIYKCDFCKNEVQENQLKNLFLGTRRYEVCKPCYEKGMTLKDKYEQEESRLYNELYSEFTKEIEALIKEERN